MSCSVNLSRLTDIISTRIAVIFASFTIHVVSMERSHGARRRVLQHKAKLCLLGLAEFRDYWPFVDWMYRLFSSLLHQPEAVQDSSKGHDQGSWTNPPRPRNTNLSADLMDSTIEVAHGNDTTMSLPLYEQNTNSTVDIQPECGVPHQFMSGTLTSENFLDPLMPLDNLDWYDPDTTNFAYLNGNAMLWTGTPSLPAEKDSRP